MLQRELHIFSSRLRQYYRKMRIFCPIRWSGRFRYPSRQKALAHWIIEDNFPHINLISPVNCFGIKFPSTSLQCYKYTFHLNPTMRYSIKTLQYITGLLNKWPQDLCVYSHKFNLKLKPRRFNASIATSTSHITKVRLTNTSRRKRKHLFSGQFQLRFSVSHKKGSGK